MACNSCNNINCQCNTGCNCNEGIRFGTSRIVDSHMLGNKQGRAVFYQGGGCDIVPKAYVPSVCGMLTSNGPKQVGCQQCGSNPAPESEGQDCLNYVFKKNRFG